jgi:hypothetical protein
MKEYIKWWILTRACVLASLMVFPPTREYPLDVWFCFMTLIAAPIVGDVVVLAVFMAFIATIIMAMM